MPSSISWVSEESFTFNGQEISRASFQRYLVHGMIADAQRIMQHKLLFTTSLPGVPLQRIADDMSNTTIGYSFTTEPLNAALFSRGFSDLKSRTLAPEDLPEYISHVNSFLELILILCLTTGGQPPISYDLTCLLLVNAHSYARSLFIMGEECGRANHGNIAIITSSLNTEPVHRLLGPQVGTLLVLYIVEVLPFLRRRQLAGVSGHEALVRSNHLFPDEMTHWDLERYEGVVKRESKRRLGVEMDLKGYKAVFLAISKRFNPGRFDDEGNFLAPA